MIVMLTLLIPLFALAFLASPRLWRAALVLAPLLLPLPALLPDLLVPAPLLLLGSSFGVDAVNRPLLLLAGLGWSLAGWFAGTAVRERPREFAAYWLLTMAGHTAAMLAADLSAFYLGYVVMTVAAYGLVVHSRTDEALRAGRIYVVLAIVGEVLVLAGLLTIGAAHGNASFEALAGLPRHPAASWLLLAGFAVKLGAVPLHLWLPLAHPVAPAPASAVLSGLLVKAGLLGMLRFIEPASFDWLPVLMAAGMATAAYGAVIGMFQQRLKTVLAYSTISQMGLALAGLGAVLAGAAPAALGLFALHHGLNKLALFVAAGHRVRGRLANALFVLSAAGLAGLPLTTGALAKSALKADTPWPLAFSVSSVLTTLLLLHAWRLAREKDGGMERPHPAWIAAVAAGMLVPWAWALHGELAPALKVSGLLDAAWPVALGAALYAGWRRLKPRQLPEGDVVVWLERLCARLVRVTGKALDIWMDWEPRLPDLLPRTPALRAAEIALGRLAVAGLSLLLILLVLWLAMQAT